MCIGDIIRNMALAISVSSVEASGSSLRCGHDCHSWAGPVASGRRRSTEIPRLHTLTAEGRQRSAALYRKLPRARSGELSSLAETSDGRPCTQATWRDHGGLAALGSGPAILRRGALPAPRPRAVGPPGIRRRGGVEGSKKAGHGAHEGRPTSPTTVVPTPMRAVASLCTAHVALVHSTTADTVSTGWLSLACPRLGHPQWLSRRRLKSRVPRCASRQRRPPPGRCRPRYAREHARVFQTRRLPPDMFC